MKTQTDSHDIAHTHHYRLPVYRVALVRDGSLSHHERPLLTAPRVAARILSSYFSAVDREHFVVLMLNAKNRLLGLNTVSVGSLTSALVSPREVFKPAILGNAAAVILSHNHLSGDLTPSAEDRAITARLVQGRTCSVFECSIISSSGMRPSGIRFKNTASSPRRCSRVAHYE